MNRDCPQYIRNGVDIMSTGKYHVDLKINGRIDVSFVIRDGEPYFVEILPESRKFSLYLDDEGFVGILIRGSDQGVSTIDIGGIVLDISSISKSEEDTLKLVFPEVCPYIEEILSTINTLNSVCEDI